MTIPIDYATLRVIWWILLGLLLVGFAVMDGFDFGVGMLLHRVARTDDERRVVLNTIGPVWEGNQIWLVLGAGVIFAAWPEVYAVSFSGFYFAMLFILLALILRPVSFKYRSKVENVTWRKVWDILLFFSGFVPALIFGVVVGNTLEGVPFYFDDRIQSFYTGSVLDLLNPYAILCGLVSVAMCAMHGANFLAIKTTGDIERRAKRYSRLAAWLVIILFALAGVWLYYKIPGYVVTSDVSVDGPSNPLHKTVTTQLGAWFVHYQEYPKLLVVPLAGFIGAFLSFVFSFTRLGKIAWFFSAISIAAIVVTVGVSMFPFILPSSTHPEMSLLVWDSSSSQFTLFIILIATIIFLPLILIYTSWVYYMLRGKVTDAQVKEQSHHNY